MFLLNLSHQWLNGEITIEKKIYAIVEDSVPPFTEIVLHYCTKYIMKIREEELGEE